MEKELYEYLKHTSLIDIITMIAKQTNIQVNQSDTAVYYTAKDLIDLYPNIFSKYKLDKYIKEENLPVLKSGKDRLFLKSSVEDWLRKRNNIQIGKFDFK